MLRTQTVLVFLCIYIKINAVPPEACFAKFRWEDCGRPPKRVLYYWKPGSRCEVGIWRGCLPNINMFHDEYECVSTCIFNARAQPIDYHILLEKEEEEVDNKIDTTEAVSATSNVTDDTENVTEGTDDTTIEGIATTVASDVNDTAVGVDANSTTVEAEVTATTSEVETAASTSKAEATATTDIVEANATTVEVKTNTTEKNENKETIAEGKDDPEETVGKSNETTTNSTS